MQRTLIALIVATLLAGGLPPAGATETVSGDYSSGLGVSLAAVGFYAGTVICPNGCTDPDPAIAPLGGVQLWPSVPYDHISVTSTDLVYGGQPAISVCLWNPARVSNDCGHESNHVSDITCGAVALPRAPYLADHATVFLYSVHVGTGFGVCGASSGTVVGVFS